MNFSILELLVLFSAENFPAYSGTGANSAAHHEAVSKLERLELVQRNKSSNGANSINVQCSLTERGGVFVDAIKSHKLPVRQSMWTFPR